MINRQLGNNTYTNIIIRCKLYDGDTFSLDGKKIIGNSVEENEVVIFDNKQKIIRNEKNDRAFECSNFENWKSTEGRLGH